MFHLYHHNDLTRLAAIQAALLDSQQRRSPLAPDVVIVPNRGVGRWLQMTLARHQGVAANLELPLMARFIWDLLPRCLPGSPDSRPYARAAMLWHLYAVLPEAAADDPAIAHYLRDAPDSLQRLQLAGKLADLFDQYLIYRPSLLTDWSAGRRATDHPAEPWQAALWRRLKQRLAERGHPADRAQLLEGLIRLLDSDHPIPSDSLPEAVYCFGLGHLPPEYLRFLYALGRRIDVHYLLPNPCDGYWGDIRAQRRPLAEPPPDQPDDNELTIEAGHPLLASLGRGTRDLLRVLYSDELSSIQEPELGPAMAYEAAASDGLLGRIQQDIIGMRVTPNAPAENALDASVQIHACHGPLREVEVLHDQLLDWLGRNPDRSPRNIVVMMPDVTAYGPAIESVFGGATGARHLPYSLSDRARHSAHPVVQSFQTLLNLPLARWAADDILSLAAVPAIARRFHLDGIAMNQLHHWIGSAGVRWGLNAATRRQFGAGDFEQNSWRFGLDRLLLGIAQADDHVLTAGVAPWSDLEGGSTAALGGLWLFVDRLARWQHDVENAVSAAAWQDRCNALLDDLFRADPDDRSELAALDELREAVHGLAEADRCLDGEPLDWITVRETLLDELAQTSTHQPFLSAGVTFCGLMPLRAVPFGMVCLIGMNDEAFPRREQNRNLNLLRHAPRTGDHSVRDDDRLLFLQALTAAGDSFYISYTGQDVTTGDTLPPSTLVGEFLDFLHASYFADLSEESFRARWPVLQPMQPFSPRYFGGADGHDQVFTFAQAWAPAGAATGQSRRTAPLLFGPVTNRATARLEHIELSTLKRFFDHPPRYYLQQLWQIELAAEDQAIDDDEPLSLDGLSAYRIREALLEQAQREDQPVELTPDALWRARGLLPPPPLDVEPFADQGRQTNALLTEWQRWRKQAQPAEAVDVDVKIQATRLTGRITPVWTDGLRWMRPGRLRMQYRLRQWIDFLALRVAGHAGGLHLAGLERLSGGAEMFTLHAELPPDKAERHLSALLDIFSEGQTYPLPVLPDLAERYLDALEKRGDHHDALDVVNRHLANSFSPPPEMRDPYFAPLLGDTLLTDPAQGDRFGRLATSICGPVFDTLRAPEEPA